MAQASDTVWLPVLPSMKDFGPALIKGTGAAAEKAGDGAGKRMGKALALGIAGVAAGAVGVGKALYEVGSTFDDVTDTIRVGTGAQGEALDGLVATAKKVGTAVPSSFEDIGSTVADVNTRMGLSGETLEKVSSQYLQAGNILGETVDINKTSAAFEAFGIKGDDVSGAMDHLFQVSQATGVGMNELASSAQRSAPALKTLGFSFEETTALVGTLDKAGLNSSAMMGAMSKGLVTLAKDGEKPQEAFQRTVTEIDGFIKKGDQAGALKLASKVFGTKGATQFVEAVGKGAVGLDNMAKAAGQTDDTILGLGTETADFAEQWQLFKNNVLVWLEPLGTKVFGALGTAMGEVTGGVRAFGAAWAANDGDITSSGFPGFMERLANISRTVFGFFQTNVMPILSQFWGMFQTHLLPVLAEFVPQIAKLWTELSPVSLLFGAIAPLLPQIGEAFGSMASTVGGLLQALIPMGQQLVQHLVPVFNTLIQSVLPVVMTLIKTFAEVVLPPVVAAFGSIVQAIGPVVGILSAVLIPLIQFLLPIVSNVFTTIANIIAGAMQAVQGIIQVVTGLIAGNWSLVWTGIQNVFGGIWNAIVGYMGGAWEHIKLIFGGALSFISGLWNTVWGAISGFFVGIWNGIVGYFTTQIEAFKLVFTLALGFLATAWENAWNGIKSFFSGIWRDIKGVFNAVITFVKTVFSAVFTWFRDSVIAPVWNGIKNIITGWWRIVSGIFSAVGSFIRNTLAPAFTWFRDSVIKPVWDGIKAAISAVWEKGIKPVFDAITNVVTKTLPDAFKKAKEAIESVFRGVANVARTPINFVIGTVYNNGLKSLFNGIAEKLGLGWRLPDVGEIPAFAKGGQHKGGWALVGEEGPELVNFSAPGRVYTAAETQAMLGGQEQAPHDALGALGGSKPADAQLAVGGFWGDVWNNVTATVGAAKDWVVGRIADGVRALVEPIKTGLTAAMPGGGINELIRGGAFKVIDDMTGWAIKKDDAKEAAQIASGAGSGAVYDGPLGAFHRPSAGPFTSMFGQRWGRLHAGVDIAGGGPTFAALPGVVQNVGWNAVAGRTGIGIVLNHGPDLWTYYGHNPSLGAVKVRPGDKVQGGQHIGEQGATGNVTGTHLHFEVQKGRVGAAVDPMPYLHDQGGWLQPGISQILNATRKPEAILNSEQWSSMHKLAAQTIERRGGDTITVIANEAISGQAVADSLAFAARRNNRRS